MSKKDPLTEVAKSCLADGWTPEALRKEDCGDPVITNAIADLMAEIASGGSK